MNQLRAARIKKLAREMEAHIADWDSLDDFANRIERIMEEEDEAYNNIPENLQYSERGMASENAASCLEEAHDAIVTAIDTYKEQVDSAIESLYAAIE